MKTQTSYRFDENTINALCDGRFEAFLRCRLHRASPLHADLLKLAGFSGELHLKTRVSGVRGTVLLTPWNVRGCQEYCPLSY